MERQLLKAMKVVSIASAFVFGSASAISEDFNINETNYASCSDLDLYFCDDFESQNSDQWNLLPETENSNTPDGAFTIVTDDEGNTSLQYTAQKNGGVLAVVKPEDFSGVDGSDYYVEAKIRPRMNSTAGSKQLYLLGRYQDGNNWYAGALNIQNSLGSTKVEVARMVDGQIKRMKKVGKPIVQGAKGELDGQWYSLRLSMKGDNLRVFFDGDKLIDIEDSSFSDKGLIGLWTANKSFEIDDVRVGNANDLPASLALSFDDIEYSAEVGDDDKIITVTAMTQTGEQDSFTVTSSDTDVVKVTVDDTTVSLAAVGSGESTITFTSASGVSKTIAASITPQFIMPTAVYDFDEQTYPAIGEVNVYEDTQLKLTFDADVTLGEGSIRIFRLSDDVMVDKISLQKEQDEIGYGNVRTLTTDPVRANGATVAITPHANVLEAGTQYYVAVSDNAITGATLAGQTYEGVGRNAGWTFTTRTQKPDQTKTELVVDDNGHDADFRTVQGALNFVMQYANADAPVTVNIMNGVYEEPLYLYQKNNVTLQGESRDGTVIRYKNNESMNSGTVGRALFLVMNADNLHLDNLTIQNSTLIGRGGQAETLYFNSVDGRLIVTNSVFISEQDTLNLKGWNWFYNSRIEGNVDFIWGYSKATLFENSEIRTLGDSRGNGNGGYLLQARNQNLTDKGFVFLNSRLTRGNGPLGDAVNDQTTYLARSGGCSSCYDNIVFVNTQMGNHIRPVGYLDKPVSLPEVATAQAGWREYNTMDLNGEPRDLSERLDVMFYELSEDEVKDDYCSRDQIFSAYDDNQGWNPLPEIVSGCGFDS